MEKVEAEKEVKHRERYSIERRVAKMLVSGALSLPAKGPRLRRFWDVAGGSVRVVQFLEKIMTISHFGALGLRK